MQTRSQTKQQQDQQQDKDQQQNNIALFEVNIDFDDASDCWRQNKKCLSNGMYKYVCPLQKIDGTKCGKVCYKTIEFCWIHRNSLAK